MLKYKAYMNRLELNPSSLDQKLTGPDKEIGRLELEWETVRQENVADNQKYSVTDTERIRHEENELEQTTNKLTKDLEAKQRQMMDRGIKICQRQRNNWSTVGRIPHKLARKLKLIPKEAENSKGYDFEIKFNPEAGVKCLVKYRDQV